MTLHKAKLRNANHGCGELATKAGADCPEGVGGTSLGNMQSPLLFKVHQEPSLWQQYERTNVYALRVFLAPSNLFVPEGHTS